MEQYDKITISGESCWGRIDEAYKDKLILKKNRISYKFIPEVKSKDNPRIDWNHRMNDMRFEDAFNRLVAYRIHLEQLQRMEVMDVLPTKIAFYFKGIKKWEFEAYNDQIKEFIMTVNAMIPDSEETPECIKYDF